MFLVADLQVSVVTSSTGEIISAHVAGVSRWMVVEIELEDARSQVSPVLEGLDDVDDMLWCQGPIGQVDFVVQDWLGDCAQESARLAQ